MNTDNTYVLWPWQIKALADSGVKPVPFDAPVDAVHVGSVPRESGVDISQTVGGAHNASTPNEG